MTESSDDKMVKLTCPMDDCQWQYDSMFSMDQNFKIVNMHFDTVHNQQAKQQVNTASAQARKLTPPSIDVGIDEEEWAIFSLRWKRYCEGCEISREHQSFQLFECTSVNLGNQLLKYNPNITSSPPDMVMDTIEKLAVIHAPRGVTRAELMKMTQANDEAIRNFFTRVQGKATTCAFKVLSTCKCGVTQPVDYTSEVVKDVVMAGINDPEVRRRVQECEGIDEKSLNDTVALIDRTEKAAKTYGTRSSSISTLSSFKRQQTSTSYHSDRQRSPPAQSPKIPCPRCKKSFHKFNGRNMRAFEVCLNCYRSSRDKRAAGSQQQSTVAVNTAVDEETALMQDLSINGIGTTNSSETASPVQRNARDHPRVSVRLRQAGNGKVVPVVVIADTGAQSNIWGLGDYLRAGFVEKDSHSTVLP